MHQKTFGDRAPPGPAGELCFKALPRPHSLNMGLLLRGGEEREGEERKGMGGEKKGKKGGEGIADGGDVEWGSVG